MSFFYLFLSGILIGTAMIVPGVSGGVIAVVLGVYEKLINSLINLFKDFKKNFFFLFILGTGILLGAIWFSKVMIFLYNFHEVETKFAFIGLILGGVPYLFKEVKKNTNKSINFKVTLISFLISIFLFFLSKCVVQIDLDKESSSLLLNIFNLFLAGFIYSVGKVIPGISGSFLLIIIGMYEFVLGVLSNPLAITLNDFIKLIPFILGLIFGILILLKLVSNLLKNNFRLMYSIIIGFVIGSVPVLIPNVNNMFNLFKGCIIMIFCFILSSKMPNKE